MADPTEISDKDKEPVKSDDRLKHLKFLSSSAELSSAYLYKLYKYLKEHSGFLGPIVEYLMGILDALVGYFDKEHKLLHHLLSFADNQVDKVTKIIETHGPNFAKKILSFVQWAFNIIGELCDAAREGGMQWYDVFVKKEYDKLQAKLVEESLIKKKKKKLVEESEKPAGGNTDSASEPENSQ